MKKLFFIAALFLLAGCTLQEAEVDQILVDLDNMARNLGQLEDLAKKQDFDAFRQKVEYANASLEHIRAWVDIAEERGEDPVLIDRVRKDYDFLSIEFETLVLNAAVVQKLEATKPFMEELKQKNTANLDAAIDSITEILAMIDRISANVDKMEAAAEKLTPQDQKVLNTKDAISKMSSFEKEISKRKEEFSGLKVQLEEIKEKMGI